MSAVTATTGQAQQRSAEEQLGLVRDALRRAGCSVDEVAGDDLAGLIDRHDREARDAVRTLGQGRFRMWMALRQIHQFASKLADDARGRRAGVHARLWEEMAELADQATSTVDGPQLPDSRLTPIELSILIQTHSPREPKPCSVCGSTDMQISRAGGGGTQYNCGAAIAEMGGKTGREYDQVARQHYRPSEQQITYHGDAEVADALRELRALREGLGEDMTVAVGIHAYPYGHGRHRCSRRLRHEGGDLWVPDNDWDYSHDPTHAEMITDEEGEG